MKWKMINLFLSILLHVARGVQPTRRLFLAESSATFVSGQILSTPLAAIASVDEEKISRTSRPLLYKIVPGQPSTMQPYINRAEEDRLRAVAQESRCVLLGVKTTEGRANAKDMDCALKIADRMNKRRKTIIALDSTTAGSYTDYLNVGIDAESMGRVQAFGLEGLLDRNKYVPDPEEFLRFQEDTQGFGIYAERVLARKYDKLNISSAPGAPTRQNFIASVLLRQYAAASLIQSHINNNPSDLVIAILADDLVKFRLGTQARLMAMGVNPCTSFLCNPTADSTYSLSPRLRLDLSLRSDALAAPVADYVIFSDPPPPSLLNRS